VLREAGARAVAMSGSGPTLVAVFEPPGALAPDAAGEVERVTGRPALAVRPWTAA
jgi:shikimate kinase